MSDADIFDKLGGDCDSTRRSEAIRLHPLITFGAKHLYFKYPSITTKYGGRMPPHTIENVIIRLDKDFEFHASDNFIHPNIGCRGYLCLGNWFAILRASYNSSIEVLYFTLQDYLSTSTIDSGYRHFLSYQHCVRKFWQYGKRCSMCNSILETKTNEHGVTICYECCVSVPFEDLKTTKGLKLCKNCYEYYFAFSKHSC